MAGNVRTKSEDLRVFSTAAGATVFTVVYEAGEAGEKLLRWNSAIHNMTNPTITNTA